MLKAKNIIYGFCKYTNPPKYKYLISLYRSESIWFTHFIRVRWHLWNTSRFLTKYCKSIFLRNRKTLARFAANQGVDMIQKMSDVRGQMEDLTYRIWAVSIQLPRLPMVCSFLAHSENKNQKRGATPKAPNVLFIFFGAKKRTERSIHLSQALLASLR